MRSSLAAVLIALLASGAHAASATDLHALFAEYDRWEKREFPEDAMRQGDYTWADRITDESVSAIERRQRERKVFLSRLEVIELDDLSAADLVNHALFDLKLRRDVEGYRHRTFLAPLGARFGLHQKVPQMGDHVRFDSTEDYLNYLRRLQQVPDAIEHVMTRMRLGVAEERVPPKIVLASLPDQFKSLLEGGNLDRLREPLDRMPATVPEGSAAMVRREFDEVTMPSVREAMATLGAYVTDEYMPACRESIAASDWPDGPAYYAHQLHVMTTTDMSAQEIHEVGLAEVARIRGEMMAVIERSDFRRTKPEAATLEGDELFAAFLDYLRTDTRFYYDRAEDLLDGYRVICKKIDLQMPRFFHVLPRLPYGVEPIPDFMAPGQTTAYYMGGDVRNAQAGIFYANTYALDQRPKYEMTALALHEAVPGHHHQIAIARELEDVPPFRRNTWFTAYGEGWALYAERLGIEMGLYEDPYDDFGRLLYEMWRACRLVVDPGMHALGWSRQETIDFMLANTALSELNIVTEVDRYIAWPGQATGYKIGELKMRELRARAEERLGDEFDLRAFHDVILSAGSIPLELLDQRIDTWINVVRLEGVSYD